MGRTAIDLTGQKFGRLMVSARIPREPGTKNHVMWLCRCDCGTVKPVGSYALRSGTTRSCGCLLSEMLVTRNTTHGLAPRRGKPRAYGSWANMIRRCTRENDPRWKDWGGRGITIDPRWLDFANFLADMGERPPGMSLERKDNGGPYCRENCIWATPHEQQVNSRNFKLIPELITEIKRLRANGQSMRAIGTRLGLHHQTVSRALSGKTRQRSKAVSGHASDHA